MEVEKEEGLETQEDEQSVRTRHEMLKAMDIAGGIAFLQR